MSWFCGLGFHKPYDDGVGVSCSRCAKIRTSYGLWGLGGVKWITLDEFIASVEKWLKV